MATGTEYSEGKEMSIKERRDEWILTGIQAGIIDPKITQEELTACFQEYNRLKKNPERDIEIWNMYMQRMTMKAIGEKTGISGSRVGQILDRIAVCLKDIVYDRIEREINESYNEH